MSQVVYLMQASWGGPVKIGTCRKERLEARLQEVQVGNPYRLVVRHVLDGGKELEEWIHEQLGNLRLRGEWFGPGEEVLWHFEVDHSASDWESVCNSSRSRIHREREERQIELLAAAIYAQREDK